MLFKLFTLSFINFTLGFPAASANESLIQGSRYTSARGAALGDAFLPLGDDVASGLFYNPAVLARIQKPVLEPINFSGFANQGQIPTVGFQGLQSPTVQSHPTQLGGWGGAVLPTLGFPGIYFGILAQIQNASATTSDGITSYRSLYQFIPAMGTGFKLLNGLVRFGYSLQWVNQSSGSLTEATSDFQAGGYTQGLSKGSTFSHNFGLAVTLPFKSLPSFNLVARNAGDSSYRNFSWLPLTPSTALLPTTEVMTFDVSFSLIHRITQTTHLNLSFVDRDLSNQSQVVFLGHFAAGAELSIHDKIFLRGGWGSGYPSAGFGFKRKGSELSFAWYSVEIGDQYLAQRDIRWMLQYQVRVF